MALPDFGGDRRRAGKGEGTCISSLLLEEGVEFERSEVSPWWVVGLWSLNGSLCMDD